MTFEEWFKKEHGSYIVRGEVEDIYGDYQPSWVEHLLHQAFEAGRGSGFSLGLTEGYREGFEIGYNAKGREF